MNLELENEKALVNGSTAGIGLAIASRLTRRQRDIVDGRTQERVGGAAEYRGGERAAKKHDQVSDLVRREKARLKRTARPCARMAA